MNNRLWLQWAGLLYDLYERGARRSPRGIGTRELLGVYMRVDNGLDNVLYHPGRNLNYQFMVAEWLWIMSGSDNLEEIAQYMPKYRQFSDDGKVLAGAYGPRLKSQIPWLLEKLNESDTRQAVATIWTPNPRPSKDIPCTVALQFLRREDVVNLIVTMRSSDIWLGLPYDFFTFSQLLSCVCGVLDCKVGFVQFNLGSSHLYENDVAKAERVLGDYYEGKSFVSQRCPGMPPDGLLECVRNREYPFRLYDDRQWKIYQRVLQGKKDDAITELGFTT